VKFHIFVLFAVIIFLNSFITVPAQADAVIGQVSSSVFETFAGGISGDGRFVVFESTGNLATTNARNADNNREIFLFDYAQRQIFQITDTKHLLTDTAVAPTQANTKVSITNVRPVISTQPDTNGNYWIAFGSNATCAYPGNGTAGTEIVSTTNPGNFDANSPPLEPAPVPTDPAVNKCLLTGSTPAVNNLTNDGNTEMWLYKVPVVPAVLDLSTGSEIDFTNLAAGTFTRVTNTRPSRLPVAGTSTILPVIADDNFDASIDDTGAAISFTSNRDLVPCPTTPTATCGNAFPSFDNDEIFTYVPATSTLTEITTTPRGSIANPIYNINSTITNLTGGGWRIAFMSNANNPVVGMTGTTNNDNNEEIFFAELDGGGALGATKKQVTTTVRTNPGDVVNIFNYGKRMSRDGRFIAFDSFADLANEHSGVNQTGFATFVYDTTLTANAFQRVLPRSNADSGAFNGDIQRYPSFTDYDPVTRAPGTIVLDTRMNIRASDGTIPTNADEGLNNVAARPAQLYSTAPAFFPPVTPPNPLPARPFKRLTKLPVPSLFLAQIQPLTSNKIQRMAFNLAQTETGTGNPDLASEVYYFILPPVVADVLSNISFETGASRILVSPSPVPTPSPTATPTPTPTPTATPTATPTPSPSPSPQLPAAAQGVAPGMLAVAKYNARSFQPTGPRTAVGSLERRFTLPIELGGVTMTVNGAACGLKSFNRLQNDRELEFVVPPGLAGSDSGTVYPVVINDNGTVIKGEITVVRARPDIFTTLLTPGPGGRARLFNATNRVLTREPFTIRTFQLRGSRLVPSILRVYITGVQDLSAAAFSVKIGNVTIPNTSPPSTILTGAILREPGVFTVDFTLPSNLAGAGDQPIVISVLVNGITYTTRLEDTAPRTSIL
jgi:hypothetical protein